MRGLSEDLRATALVDQLNALEARLGEQPRDRRRTIWRGLTYSSGALTVTMMDLSLTNPLVLAMLAGFGLEYLIPFVVRRRLNRERDKLVAQHERITGMTQPHQEAPDSIL